MKKQSVKCSINNFQNQFANINIIPDKNLNAVKGGDPGLYGDPPPFGEQ